MPRTDSGSVIAVGETGLVSAPTDAVEVEVVDPQADAPPTPQGLAASWSDSGIVLTWAAVDGAVAYDVYRAAGGRTPVLTEHVTEATWTDASAVPSAVHTYQVTAVGPGGVSERSDMVEVAASVQFARQAERIDRAPVAVERWVTDEFDIWGEQYLDIPLNRPAGGVTPPAGAYQYRANDASIGDLDGDGEYEVILKWDPTNAQDNPDGAAWYVVGTSTELVGDDGQDQIGAGHLGWAPELIDGGESGLVGEDDQVDTILDDGPNNFGVVDQELLAIAVDSQEIAEEGSWTATARHTKKGSAHRLARCVRVWERRSKERT